MANGVWPKRLWHEWQGRIIAPMDAAVMTIRILAESGAGSVAVPAATDWAAGLVVLIVWVLVAAVVVGPLMRKFKLFRRSTQVFAEDLAPGRKS